MTTSAISSSGARPVPHTPPPERVPPKVPPKEVKAEAPPHPSRGHKVDTKA